MSKYLVWLLLAACSSTTSSTGSSSSAVKPSCYMNANGVSCECSATNDDANRPASDWTKVSSCNESSIGGEAACYADTTVDGKTKSCNCIRLHCQEASGFCACGTTSYAAASISDVTSCTGFDFCCANSSGTNCHCGNGTAGSACGNDEHNVDSCGLDTVKRASDEKASCDGLTWAPPPPPSSGGGGGGSGGCSSSSECMGKCSTRCYDCRAKSCVCGRLTSAGSCTY